MIEVENLKVAVLLPTYRPHPFFFSAQLNSILDQTHKNIEVHLFPDSEGDLKSLLQIPRIKDPKVHVHSFTKNLGVYRNVERGLSWLANLNIDYIALADQDDVWDSKKIEVQLFNIKRQGSVVDHCDLMAIDENDRIMFESVWEYECRRINNPTIDNILAQNIANGCSILFDVSLVKNVLPFPDVVGLFHDHWILLCAIASGGTLSATKHPLVKYRQHGSNLVGAQNLDLQSISRKLLSPRSLMLSAELEYRRWLKSKTEITKRFSKNPDTPRLAHFFFSATLDLRFSKRLQLQLGKFIFDILRRKIE